MVFAELPAVGQTVELWFAGYDEFYPGKVTSVSPPLTFDVLLEDGSSWPVNSKNNVWRYGRNEDADVHGNDDDNAAKEDVQKEDKKPSRLKANVDTGNDDDDDDDVAAPLAEHTAQPLVEEGKQAASQKPDQTQPAFEETIPESPDVIPETQLEEIEVPVDGKEDTGPQELSAKETDKNSIEKTERPKPEKQVDTDVIASTDKVVEEDLNEEDKSASTKTRQTGSDAMPGRRKSGRAFRKSAATSRNVGPTPDPSNEVSADTSGLAAQRRSARAEAIAADEAARANGNMKTLASRASPKKPEGSARRSQQSAEKTPEKPEPTRSTRRTRQNAGAGRKRPLDDVGDDDGNVEEVESEGPQVRASPQQKRRKKTTSHSAQRGKLVGTRSTATGNGSMLTSERVTRSAAARAAADLEPSYRGSTARQKEDEGIEKLSTKAVTAIAVDAALASAKAVLKPLHDRVISVQRELEDISAVSKKAAMMLSEEPKPKRKGRSVSSSSPISAAALESFHLDLSELIGGGEARINAYSNLSEQEFEELHRAIESQEAALRQLDRLLYAAQALSEKAKKNGGATAAPKETRSGRRTRSG